MRLRISLFGLLLASCGSEYDVNSGVGNDRAANEDSGGLWDLTDGDDDNFPEGSASVTGRICNTAADGYVFDAMVTIEVRGQIYRDFTDEDGRFTIAGVPLGRHTVLAQKGSFSAIFEIVLDTPGEEFSLAEEECLDPDSVDIAVVRGSFDHIENLLQEMNLTYVDYDAIETDQYMTLMTDPTQMARYDVIFFNCGMSNSWYNSEHAGDIAQNILQYVESGGSIYVSDRAYLVLEAAFPAAVEFYSEDSYFDANAVGHNGIIDADIVDPTFQTILGQSKAELIYNLPNWVVPVGVSPEVQLLARGDAEVEIPLSKETLPVKNIPLAARLKVGEEGGVVLFTSFHNENQITLDMRKILEEIVFSL